MTKILHIESATKMCSVAISENNKIIAIREQGGKYAHAELLTVFIDEVLKESKLNASDLDAVAVSKGPGSYTGLRIGVSAAKGLCYAIEKPLISISTLKSLAYGVAKEIQDAKALYCPMLDARRMEVYCSLLDQDNNEIQETKALIIDQDSFSNLLEERVIYFFGDGADKCKDVIQHKNARFLSGKDPSSKFMVELAKKKYSNGEFEDVAYFEPYYLKDFVAGKPKVKGLN
jgi:tRNA threonylcarbamoyladenosine biosynthesis protein TsaB